MKVIKLDSYIEFPPLLSVNDRIKELEKQLAAVRERDSLAEKVKLLENTKCLACVRQGRTWLGWLW